MCAQKHKGALSKRLPVTHACEGVGIVATPRGFIYGPLNIYRGGVRTDCLTTSVVIDARDFLGLTRS